MLSGSHCSCVSHYPSFTFTRISRPPRAVGLHSAAFCRVLGYRMKFICSYDIPQTEVVAPLKKFGTHLDDVTFVRTAGA